MNKWISLRTMPGVVTACGLVALAVVTLSWAPQARGFAVGSEDALEASLFDPFSLTADPFRSPTIRLAAPSRLPVAAAPTPTAPEAGIVSYVPPVRVPYRPPLRSPSRPPLQ